jgi:hypothetical protein
LVFLLIIGLAVNGFARKGNSVVELNINNDDLELHFATLKKWSRNSQTYFGIGVLSGYDDYDYDGDDKHEHKLYDATLTQIGYTDIKGISFGVGFKAVYANLDDLPTDKDLDVSAVGLRLKLLYTLPLRVKTIVAGTYNFAPKSLCFSSDLSRYNEYRLEINAEPIDGAWVYAGFREIEFTFEDLAVVDGEDTYTFNKAGYFGVKIYY